MSKTINAGRVTFVPKDNFSNNISYKKFDIVTYNGSSYFAKKDTIGHIPTEDEFWQLVAEKGQNGEPGAVKMQVVDTLPETGETDTIYLVKKSNPGEQNLYDEYVYANGAWEHIGDTSVDLSNYYTKTEVKQITGELTDLSTENKSNLVNAVNEVFNKPTTTLLENKTIDLNNLDIEYGTYIISGSDTVIKYNNKSEKPLTQHSKCVLLLGKNDFIPSSGYAGSYAIIFINPLSGGFNMKCYTNKGSTTVTFDQIVHKNQNCEILGLYNFYNKLPTSSLVPTSDNQLVNKKYVDDSVVTKQDVLTAGENITIDGNVISASGGSCRVYNIDTTSNLSDKNIYFETDVLNEVTEIINKNLDNTFILFINFTKNDNKLKFELNFKTPTSNVSNAYSDVYGYSFYIPSEKDTKKKFSIKYDKYSNGTILVTQFKSTTNPLYELTASDVLTKTNTTSYTPTSDYNPATKKYVDDAISSAITTSLEASY